MVKLECKGVKKTKRVKKKKELFYEKITIYPCSVVLSRIDIKAELRKLQLASKKKKPGLECVFCEKRFSNYLYFQRHSVTHTKEKPYFCMESNCDMSFSIPERLTYHHLNYHSGRRPFKCDGCPMTFKTFTLKYQHEQRTGHDVTGMNGSTNFGKMHYKRKSNNQSQPRRGRPPKNNFSAKVKGINGFSLTPTRAKATKTANCSQREW